MKRWFVFDGVMHGLLVSWLRLGEEVRLSDHDGQSTVIGVGMMEKCIYWHMEEQDCIRMGAGVMNTWIRPRHVDARDAL